MSHWEKSVGASDEWYTPKYIFDALSVTFDLDVAHPDRETFVPAKNYYSSASLEKQWSGFIWMNPPFGGRNGLAPWLERFISHGNGIALVPDRTSAPWFQNAAKNSDAILFVSPKVRFVRPDGTVGESPSTGTALLAKGALAVASLKRGRNLGFICCEVD